MEEHSIYLVVWATLIAPILVQCVAIIFKFWLEHTHRN